MGWIWVEGALLSGTGGEVVCNEMGQLSDRDRLIFCMWSGFGDESR